jgi:hypothetical protein
VESRIDRSPTGMMERIAALGTDTATHDDDPAVRKLAAPLLLTTPIDQ